MRKYNSPSCNSTVITIKSCAGINTLKLSTPISTDEDIYSKVENFLLESSQTYPSIEDWWKTRVIPGIKNKERDCQAVVIDGELAGLSIVKWGSNSSKLCTFKVHEKYRGYGVGHYLLHRTLRQILSRKSSRVHYTISESIMSQFGGFFSNYGFAMSSWKRGRYVRGIDELLFSTNARTLIKAITMNTKKTILLSIKPEYARRMEQGEKLIEFRRKFIPDLKSARALFYVSHPVKEIRLMADICEVIKSDPSLLWNRFKSTAGVDFEGFTKYFDGVSEGNALVLSNIKPLSPPLPLDNLRSRLAGFVPPQSYKVLKDDDPLFPLVSSSISD